MVNSISDVNMSGLMAAYAKEQMAQQQLQISVVKKALDAQKIQGEAALKLIESASNVSTQGVDIYV